MTRMSKDDRLHFVQRKHKVMTEKEMVLATGWSIHTIKSDKKILGINNRKRTKEAVAIEMMEIESIICRSKYGLLVKDIIKAMKNPPTEQAVKNQLKKLVKENAIAIEKERSKCGRFIFRYRKPAGRIQIPLEEVSTKLLMMPLSKIGSCIRPLSNTMSR